MKSFEKAAAALIGLSIAGCGKVTGANLDNANTPGMDAGTDSTADSAQDAVMDSNVDAKIDSGPDANLDAASDSTSDAPSDSAPDAAVIINLTRGELAKSITSEILKKNLQGKCTVPFNDVPADSELCNAVQLVVRRAAMDGYKNAQGEYVGKWGSDDYVTRSQLWKTVTKTLGFAAYNAQCLNGFSENPAGQWYGSYLGALCDKGFITDVTMPDGQLHANDNETVEAWGKFKNNISGYLGLEANRSDIAEASESIILGNNDYGTISCNSTSFTDIPSDSLACATTTDLAQKGLIDTSQTIFRPTDLFNMGELTKLYCLVGNIDLTPGPNCINAGNGNWWYSYANAMCNKGYVATNEQWNSSVTRDRLIDIAWRVREQ